MKGFKTGNHRSALTSVLQRGIYLGLLFLFFILWAHLCSMVKFWLAVKLCRVSREVLNYLINNPSGIKDNYGWMFLVFFENANTDTHASLRKKCMQTMSDRFGSSLFNWCSYYFNCTPPPPLACRKPFYSGVNSCLCQGLELESWLVFSPSAQRRKGALIKTLYQGFLRAILQQERIEGACFHKRASPGGQKQSVWCPRCATHREGVELEVWGNNWDAAS